MPLTMTFPDPTATQPVGNCYIYCSFMALNFGKQEGRIVYAVHRDQASAYAGKVPLGEIAYNLTPTGTPAVYGDPPILDPGTPGVPEVRDPVTDEVITPAVPAVPPTYGDAPIITPAFPSFNELVMVQNGAAFASVAVAVYTLALSRPEFANATVI